MWQIVAGVIFYGSNRGIRLGLLQGHLRRFGGEMLYIWVYGGWAKANGEWMRRIEKESRGNRLKQQIFGRGKRWAIVAAAAMALGGHKSAWAISQSFYWDINGAGFGSSGGTTAAGTWDTATSNWTTDSSGDSPTTTWSNGGAIATTAVFAAGTNATGAYGVTMGNGASILVGGITFNQGTVTIAPANNVAATLALTGTATFSVASPSATDTINQAISGTGTLLTGGSGTLILGGHNTYSGSTNIYGASIKLGVSNALPIDHDISSVLSGPVLDLNGFNQAADNPAVVTNSSTTLSTYTIDSTITSGIGGTANKRHYRQDGSGIQQHA